MIARFVVVMALVATLLPAAVNAQGRFANASRRGPVAGQHTATSTNFIVSAPDARLANQVASEAERFRKELSVLWLGYEIKPWAEPCPIQVRLDRHAGGETSFAFVGDGLSPSVPTGWRMEIFGPPNRLLDAVLPHEITHTIFATHFGRPLPRWADEGACTTVEHQSERSKNHRMLIDFLTSSPSRGIPFNRMFTMRQYPHDILPLYAQGYSLAKFLIMQKGRRQFLDYLADGMDAQRHERDSQAWDVATDEHYGYRDLSELQLAWIAWVKAGSIEQPLLAATLASHVTEEPATTPTRSAAVAQVAAANTAGGWYARQMRIGRSNLSPSGRVSTNRQAIGQVTANVASAAAVREGDAAETANADVLDPAMPPSAEPSFDGSSPAGFRDSRVESATLWR